MSKYLEKNGIASEELNLLFIHGWGGSRQSLTPLAESTRELLLAEGKSATVNVIELPGFGETKLESVFDFENYLDFVRAEIGKFENDGKGGTVSLILIGHSFGGNLILRLGIENAYPEAKLVIIDSSGLFPNNSLKKRVFKIITSVLKPFKYLLLKFGLKKVYLFMQKAFYKFIVRARDYQKINEAGNELLKGTFQNVVHRYLDPEQLKKIENETLILWGEADKDTPVFMGRKLHELIKGSQLVTFPEATHGLPLRQPQDCAKEIVKFII